MELSVLQKYRESLTFLQQHNQQHDFNFMDQNDSFHSLLSLNNNNHCSKQEQPYLLHFSKLQQQPLNNSSIHCLSRTSSTQLVPLADVAETAVAEEESCGRRITHSSSKRKTEIIESQQQPSNKKVKGEPKAKSSPENSGDTSKENSKPDFIHVRARRGQATDSHSLAERARREKISKKMKCLQDLVPGCDKITGKAGMLDEIINYVQSLQRQVEFLSMKLATINPTLDFNPENLGPKEFHSCNGGFPPTLPNLSHAQLNLTQEESTNCSLDALINQSGTPCFAELQLLSNWDSDLQTLYNHSLG
ncbi:hypothetical protein ACFE04_000187 [Oxalis oulophora]